MKQKLLIICCIVLGLTLSSSSVLAQEEQPEREQPVQEVFQTALVYPQERGEVQFSYTSRYSKGKGRSLWQTPLTLEYGITDRWQVEVEWDVRSTRTETGESPTRGRGDFSVGTQYSFMNMHGSDFHSAIGLEVTIPTGSVAKELSEGFIEYEPYVIFAKDFPKLNHMQLFTQVGVGFVQRADSPSGNEEPEPAAHEFTLNAGMFVPFRRLVFTTEFSLSTNRWNHGGTEREMYLTPGIVWRLPRNWEFGVGVPLGITSRSAKYGSILKMTYEFGTRSDQNELK